MDKQEAVQCLQIANELWAIEGANPYSVKAHERAAEAILYAPLTINEILGLPPGTIHGVGRETLAMLRALEKGGMAALLERLEISIPIRVAELTRLPGIGPKTAHTLVHQHGIQSADDLSTALSEGRLGRIPGLGPSRLARLRRDLCVFLDRNRFIPIASAWPFAMQLEHQIRSIPGVQQVSVTGDVRRCVVMSPAIEWVVCTEDADRVLEWVRQFGYKPKSSASGIVAMAVPGQENRVPLRLYLTGQSNFASVLMGTTGDDTHQGVIKGLLQDKGIEWRTGGLLRQDGSTVSVAAERDIYALVGLPFLPPEIREGQGVLCPPAELVTRSDLRGDLHVHSTWSDGSLSIREIVYRAEALGYEYIAITDHSQSLTIAGGLTPERLQAQKAAIEAVQQQTRVKILHGIEVDILPDGRLDLPDETLFDLDLVIASVHSAMHQTREQMTRRIIRAIEHPAVHIIGHLTGRILGRRAAYELDTDLMVQEAHRHGVMLELNANPNRLDISEELLRQAKAAGMLVPVSTDAHHIGEFDYMEYGIRMAQRGWLHKDEVLNTLPQDQLQVILQKRRE